MVHSLCQVYFTPMFVSWGGHLYLASRSSPKLHGALDCSKNKVLFTLQPTAKISTRLNQKSGGLTWCNPPTGQFTSFFFLTRTCLSCTPRWAAFGARMDWSISFFVPLLWRKAKCEDLFLWFHSFNKVQDAITQKVSQAAAADLNAKSAGRNSQWMWRKIVSQGNKFLSCQPIIELSFGSDVLVVWAVRIVGHHGGKAHPCHFYSFQVLW